MSFIACKMLSMVHSSSYSAQYAVNGHSKNACNNALLHVVLHVKDALHTVARLYTCLACMSHEMYNSFVHMINSQSAE